MYIYNIAVRLLDFLNKQLTKTANQKMEAASNTLDAIDELRDIMGEQVNDSHKAAVLANNIASLTEV